MTNPDLRAMQFILVLSLIWIQTEGANILAFLPIPAYSHFNGFEIVLQTLAHRGHNVTVVSAFPQKKPIPNYHDVVIPLERFSQDEVNFTYFNGLLFSTYVFSSLCLNWITQALSFEEVQRFIREDQTKFDLIILEPLTCQEPCTALSHKYGAPYIALQPLILTGPLADSFGNPNPYSYVPYMLAPLSDKMTFLERGLNTLHYVGNLISYHFYFKHQYEQIMKDYMKYPGSENVPPLEALLSNVSLVLVDAHFSITSPRPNQPNVVEVAGLSIKEGDDLPEDLKKILDEAKDGAILMTLGSCFNSSHLQHGALDKLISVFSKLNQRVIMKLTEEKKLEIPNIYTSLWVPQSQILGHPNTRVFISHCGIHGLTEAVFHGVPILATPLFADQIQNMKFAVEAGYALYLDLDNFTESDLIDALTELLYNPKYKERAVLQSKITRDRPLSPLDTAIYWIEYVIRYEGASHLRPAVLQLTWYQYLLLDIIGALLIAVFSSLLLFMCLWRRIFGNTLNILTTVIFFIKKMVSRLRQCFSRKLKHEEKNGREKKD